MNSHRRFLKTMRYETPDRVPYFEEGLRDDVLDRWHEQGLTKDADLSGMFQTDRRERIPVNIDPLPPINKWPASRRGLKALRKRLDPENPARFPDDWLQRAAAWKTRDHVLELGIHHGFFLSMGVHGWDRFNEVIQLLHDDPGLVLGIMEVHGEFSARMAERVLKQVDVDFVSFSEPIGGEEGPLLSPRTYQEFVLSSYQPILEVLRRHNVDVIVLVTYANARVLLPCILRAGFNCLWACEANTDAMDYLTLRREFGRDLRLIGGIDLDILAQGKDAICRELWKRVPPLLADGGYLPLADGRVRANVPFEDYIYYRRLIQEIVEGNSKPSTLEHKA